jgi:hypothetical protein
MKKIIALSVLFLFAVGIFVLAISVKPTSAAPCQSCTTWGQIKQCYLSNPPECCSCGKEDSRQTANEYYNSDY